MRLSSTNKDLLFEYILGLKSLEELKKNHKEFPSTIWASILSLEKAKTEIPFSNYSDKRYLLKDVFGIEETNQQINDYDKANSKALRKIIREYIFSRLRDYLKLSDEMLVEKYLSLMEFFNWPSFLPKVFSSYTLALDTNDMKTAEYLKIISNDASEIRTFMTNYK